MKTTKERIEIMQAHDDGVEVEFKSISADLNAGWSDLPPYDHNDPQGWNWEQYDHRIKLKSVFMNEYAKAVNMATYSTKDEAIRWAHPNATRLAVEYKEVEK